MSELVEVRLRATGEVHRFQKVDKVPSLPLLTRRAREVWGMASPKFVFETSTRERAHVDSDFAFRVAASAQGTLYVEEAQATDEGEPLLSMSVCLSNVLAAALNPINNGNAVSHPNANVSTYINRPPSPPSPPLVASLFNNPITPIVPIAPISSASAPVHTSTSISTASPPFSRARSPSPSSPTSRNVAMTTPPSLSPPTSRPRSPLLENMNNINGPHAPVNMNISSMNSGTMAERRFSEYYFCTHRGVQCVSCSTKPICGTRYLSADDSHSVCEPCRRSSRMGNTSCCSYMVYDHPWESAQEYEHVAELRAPPAPLFFGDIGPKVIHLHFTLYTLGYLFLLAPGFDADTFNNVTSDAIQRFQSDFNIDNDGNGNSVYSHRTRSSIVTRMESIRHNRSSPCRRNNTPATNPRVRLRSALAA